MSSLQRVLPACRRPFLCLHVRAIRDLVPDELDPSLAYPLYAVLCVMLPNVLNSRGPKAEEDRAPLAGLDAATRKNWLRRG